MKIKTVIPWQVKIISKLVLSRIPSGYRFWQRLGLFKHGYMEQPAYAYNVFKNHYDRVNFSRKGKGFVALELGPGDSLFSALICYAFGASASYLIDTGRFARNDLIPYRLMMNYLLEQGHKIPDVAEINSLNDMLTICGSLYGTKGVNSLQAIPSETVDFVWSQAVLEHVRRHEFPDTMRELRRVLRPDGVCSHRIDLKDHLGGALNNLRFSRDLWESDLMTHSGFYTNRIRYPESLKLFRDGGFSVEIVKIDYWDKLPTPVNKLSMEFRHFKEDELRVSGLDVILRPK